MAPAGSLDLPVPPGDGLWEASAPSGDPPGGEGVSERGQRRGGRRAAAADDSTGTEDEEN